ncbi:hypothetical protein [Pseudomonas syringae]|uniref:hypothetical protein n=1 Tax=Pseudomonas syringae TaxID=317 RepID=UPI001F3C660A|nr:hypothetical protein [Pseudomonas syringae]
MSRADIQNLVLESTNQFEQDCHPAVINSQQEAIARYCRLNAACDSLESFMGFRPVHDEDLFEQLSARRREIADVLAAFNLDAHLADVREGIYLAIPFFSRCSDLQPVWLVNLTLTDIVYIGRKLYAFASADDEIDEYAKQGSAFGDKIANASRIAPGNKVKIDDYSMSFDGDFVGTHRVVLLRGAEQVEMVASIGKLGGYLWDRDAHGIHLLEDAVLMP